MRKRKVIVIPKPESPYPYIAMMIGFVVAILLVLDIIVKLIKP